MNKYLYLSAVFGAVLLSTSCQKEKNYTCFCSNSAIHGGITYISVKKKHAKAACQMYGVSLTRWENDSLHHQGAVIPTPGYGGHNGGSFGTQGFCHLDLE